MEQSQQTEWEIWKNTPSKTLQIQEFRTAKDLLKTILHTKEYYALILHGQGGCGKTVSTLAEVKDILKPEQWSYLNGYSTPLSLHEFLYFNRLREVIILDDCAGLFKSEVSLNLLKGATEEVSGQRLVQYHSTSSMLTVPQQFMMHAKIILLCNKIPRQNDISVKAFLSRAITYEVTYSYKQKIRVCKQFVKENQSLTIAQKKQVNQILEENTNEATKDFNFRNLKQLIAFVKYDVVKAEKLFIAVTPEDENLSAYFKAIKKHPKSMKLAVKLFNELCGQSKMSFYRIRKKQKKVNKK